MMCIHIHLNKSNNVNSSMYEHKFIMQALEVINQSFGKERGIKVQENKFMRNYQWFICSWKGGGTSVSLVRIHILCYAVPYSAACYFFNSGKICAKQISKKRLPYNLLVCTLCSVLCNRRLEPPLHISLLNFQILLLAKNKII